MNYKTQSMLTIAAILGFMVVTAVLISSMEGSMTGAVVKPVCKCVSDSDCDDRNSCTEDICLYKESCEASLCVNKKIENCR